MAIRHHSQLVCWQLASAFRKEVYAETATESWKRDWSLRHDLRRSARSVAANIAEGFWRYHRVDFARFLGIALGSLGESEDHLESACLDGLVGEARRAQLSTLILRTRVATQRLRATLLSLSTPSAPRRATPDARRSP
jgi:four helix bundle protein